MSHVEYIAGRAKCVIARTPIGARPAPAASQGVQNAKWHSFSAVIVLTANIGVTNIRTCGTLEGGKLVWQTWVMF
jgi:hypothetical protein